MNPNTPLVKPALALALCLSLAACGGGGGSGGYNGGSNGGGGGDMNAPPTVTTQPLNATTTAGQMASFAAAANGNPAPSFQWERSSDGATWGAIGGATGASYSFSSAKADNAAQFRLKAVNIAGTATSNAATLTVQWPPEFTTQPTSQFVGSPNPAVFSALADANPMSGYQWQSSSNGTQWTDLPGATGTSYNTGPTSNGMNGLQFRSIGTNVVGSATSSAATLMVNVPTFMLTVNLGAGATGSPATTGSYAAGTAVNYSYTAQAGYTNLQVLLDGGAASAGGTVTMDAAHTLTASAVPIQYSVTFTAGAGGSLSGNTSQSVAAGASTTPVTAVPSGGYSFVDWTGSGFTASATNPLTLSNVAHDYALTANFSAVPMYALTVMLGTGTSGTPSSSGNYAQGSVVNYSYAAQSGYTNLQVNLDAAPVAASGSVTMNSAHTLTATAQAMVMPNTIEVGQGGLLFAPSSLTVTVGTHVTFHWASSGHSVVIGTPCTDGGILNTGVQSAGYQIVYTPMAAGDVPYFCQPHCGFGMTGVIHVNP